MTSTTRRRAPVTRTLSADDALGKQQLAHAPPRLAVGRLLALLLFVRLVEQAGKRAVFLRQHRHRPRALVPPLRQRGVDGFHKLLLALAAEANMVGELFLG